jgi:hypothetical protein
MTSNPKSTKDAPQESPARNASPASETLPFTAFATLFHKGVKRLAEMQKQALEAAANQTTDVMDAWENVFPVPASAHGATLVDPTSKWTDNVAQMLGEAADRTVAAQKLLLDFAAEQNKVAAGALKRQAGLDGSTAAAVAIDTMQRNVDVAIQTQKELMEAATRPLKAAAGKRAA